MDIHLSSDDDGDDDFLPSLHSKSVRQRTNPRPLTARNDHQSGQGIVDAMFKNRKRPTVNEERDNQRAAKRTSFVESNTPSKSFHSLVEPINSKLRPCNCSMNASSSGPKVQKVEVVEPEGMINVRDYFGRSCVQYEIGSRKNSTAKIVEYFEKHLDSYPDSSSDSDMIVQEHSSVILKKPHNHTSFKPSEYLIDSHDDDVVTLADESPVHHEPVKFQTRTQEVERSYQQNPVAISPSKPSELSQPRLKPAVPDMISVLQSSDDDVSERSGQRTLKVIVSDKEDTDDSNDADSQIFHGSSARRRRTVRANLRKNAYIESSSSDDDAEHSDDGSFRRLRRRSTMNASDENDVVDERRESDDAQPSLDISNDVADIEIPQNNFDEKVPCPVCFKEFSTQDIEHHASKCVDRQQQSARTPLARISKKSNGRQAKLVLGKGAESVKLSRNMQARHIKLKSSKSCPNSTLKAKGGDRAKDKGRRITLNLGDLRSQPKLSPSKTSKADKYLRGIQESGAETVDSFSGSDVGDDHDRGWGAHLSVVASNPQSELEHTTLLDEGGDDDFDFEGQFKTKPGTAAKVAKKMTKIKASASSSSGSGRSRYGRGRGRGRGGWRGRGRWRKKGRGRASRS